MKTGLIFLGMSLMTSIIGATVGGFIGWKIGTVNGLNEEDFWLRCCTGGWVVGLVIGLIASWVITGWRRSP